MWSLILFFVCIIGLAVEIGWKECNWGYLIAIAVFFGIAFLCYIIG